MSDTPRTDEIMEAWEAAVDASDGAYDERMAEFRGKVLNLERENAALREAMKGAMYTVDTSTRSGWHAFETLRDALHEHEEIAQCSNCGKPLVEWVHRCKPVACENCGATEQPDQCSGGSRCKFPPLKSYSEIPTPPAGLAAEASVFETAEASGPVGLGPVLTAWSAAIDRFCEDFRDSADYDDHHGGAWIINDSAYQRAIASMNAAFNAALAAAPDPPHDSGSGLDINNPEHHAAIGMAYALHGMPRVEGRIAVNARQWDGDMRGFQTWFGQRCPVDARERISVPSGQPGSWLSVWCGSWVVRHSDGCNYAIPDAFFRTYFRPAALNPLPERRSVVAAANTPAAPLNHERSMSMSTITPTIGRVVWFVPSKNTGESGFTQPSGDQPCAALIAFVHSPTMVNLAVFDANGVAHSRTSVRLIQEGEPKPDYGYYCEWMPYQRGQAAKTEALEKQVAAGA